MAEASRYVCPACRTPLLAPADAYHCEVCGRSYPILFGIPDFRLRSDRYLSLEAEREKAQRLYDYGLHASFKELVDYYYAITDDVPPELAGAFAGYVRDAPQRSAPILDDIGDSVGSGLLDVGCGSGGVLVSAAGRYRRVVGVDIALRWLVICQKRLAETGVQVELVCADVEALPYADAEFNAVVASDLLEHVYDVGEAVAALARQLAPGGRLWLSANNRFWPGPHPSVGVWAIGFFPRQVRSGLLQRLRGIDSLRYVTLVSPFGIARACKREGLSVQKLGPKAVNTDHMSGRSPMIRRLASAYLRLCSLPGARSLLTFAGPAFELIARR